MQLYLGVLSHQKAQAGKGSQAHYTLPEQRKALLEKPLTKAPLTTQPTTGNNCPVEVKTCCLHKLYIFPGLHFFGWTNYLGT